MAVPDVSIIIVNYNTCSYLQQSIESVSRGFQRYTTEIIVVDNGSTDGSVEYIQSLPHIRILCNTENQGFARANNQAFEVMRGNHAFLLNTDAFMHDLCGDLLMDFMLKNPTVGIVVPTHQFPNGNWRPSFYTIPSIWKLFLSILCLYNLQHRWYRFMDRWARSLMKPRQVDYGVGAGLLVHGSLLRQLGGLSSKYFFGGEDRELGLKALKAGWQTWWLPSARLTHVGGGTLALKNLEHKILLLINADICFLSHNYPPSEARIIYVMKSWYFQLLFLTTRLLSYMPILHQKFHEKVIIRRVVRDLYWYYLPKENFHQIVGEMKENHFSRPSQNQIIS